VKNLDSLGEKERAIVDERRRTSYRVETLNRFGGELEPTLRALLALLLPNLEVDVDLVGFVDSHAEHTLGQGERPPGVPPAPQLLRRGLEVLSSRGFANAPESEQEALVRRMRRGEAEAALGIPAKAFIDRLLVLALAGYLSHPDTWERIGFNGPAYPEGYAWISPSAIARRHEGFAGAGRL
jgi:gluconate 2-dehydrogenase subunit 3-like protein